MTSPQERPIYRKQNSFVALRGGSSEAKTQVLALLSKLRENPERAKTLTEAHARLLECALSDVLDPVDCDDGPRFSLSPNVIDEILSLDDESSLPRYLAHRYRYEIFPQQRVVDGFPPYLQIEPSSICNYRCVFCFETDESFTRKSNGFMGHMTLNAFRNIIDQAVGNVEFLSLASRGEPLLCPDIVPMLEYTAGKFLNLKINTNASLLDEPKCHAILGGGVKTVVFSADAAAEPLYSKLRVNGRLDKVLANVERFHRIRETQYPESRVITRVSGVKISDGQDIEAMERFWGGLVDQVAFVGYNPWENTYEQSVNEISQPCSDLWRRMFVWWDGKVNPCDVDYKSRLCIGSALDVGLGELWQSSAYGRLRDLHQQGGRSRLEPCSRCTVT